MRFRYMLGLLLLPWWTGLAAHAAVPECQLRVLLPVTDDLQNHWPAGKVLPVDIFRKDPQGGAFCASGGSCIPLRAGAASAAKLLNCRIGPSISSTDFRLVPDPALAGADVARAMQERSRVEEKLSALGFSNASAGSLADEFVDHPDSAPSRLVRRALAGSRKALADLKRTYP